MLNEDVDMKNKDSDFQTLIEHNLSLSYEERIRQHQSALDLVLELENARASLKKLK